QDLDNLDMDTWVSRVWELDRQFAFAWKNATSIAERERLYQLYGIRYSPIQRLSYCNVIICTVLDVMHMFIEGLFPTHVRKIFGM
ncbi:hypothetical protein K523DRAFT_221943, partial [Schizophyllum commune Tattone D]